MLNIFQRQFLPVGRVILCRFYNFATFDTQMRVAIFLACLCFFALRGYQYVYTATHADNAVCSHRHCEQEQPPTPSSRHTIVVKNIPASEEGDYLIDEESEDDDISNLFVKKYRMLSAYALCTPLLEEHTCSRFKMPQPFGSHLAEKYITQRVLRI